MMIRVKSSDVNLTIPVPMGLVCNRVTAEIGGKAIEKHVSKEVLSLDSHQLNRLMREIRRVTKLCKGLDLVEVEAADGTYVRITL